MSQKALSQVLRQLPTLRDPNVLVGAASADDAGVYRLTSGRALVQTVDFFTPIVDDPFCYGQIAATNAISDIYAMGGRPLTALNIMGIPTDLVPNSVIAEILRGGAAKAKEAGCAIIGGHTIRNPEPIYGLAVTGIVSPRRMLTNARARAADLLVLTKPLGTGIITTGIKRGLTSPALAKKAIGLMCRLNTIGAVLAELRLIRAAVDVTGFGLLGHLASMCRASGVGAEIVAAKVPVISLEVLTLIAQDCVPGGTRQNLKTANAIVKWNNTPEPLRLLLADAQTSGGLLLCVPPRRLQEVELVLKKQRTACATIIGQIVPAGRKLITLSPR
ncbi:MAG: selenide, water dikinase [Verrucomicrobiota bacterium]